MKSISDKIIDRIKDLPPVSKSFFQIMKITGNPNYSFQEIARVIEYDPVLTAKILKVTNSSSLGLKRTFDSVKAAIPYLGEKTIIGMAVDSCAHGFYNSPLDGYLSLEGELWKHSIMTALIAKEIIVTAINRVPDPNQVFTAGILHDIGKMVISGLLSEAGVLEANGVLDVHTFLDREEALISINHCEAGRLLAQHWGLPELYQQVIFYHHNPQMVDQCYASIVYAVHLSDIVAMEYGMGTGVDSLQYRLDQDYKNFYDISTEKLYGIISKADDEYNKINEFFKA